MSMNATDPHDPIAFARTMDHGTQMRPVNSNRDCMFDSKLILTPNASVSIKELLAPELLDCSNSSNSLLKRSTSLDSWHRMSSSRASVSLDSALDGTAQLTPQKKSTRHRSSPGLDMVCRKSNKILERADKEQNSMGTATYVEKQLQSYRKKKKELIDELQEIEISPCSQYVRLSRVIGKGSFKTVYLGQEREKETHVAWSVLQACGMDRKLRQSFRDEIDLLKKFRHKNIMRYFHSWDREDNGMRTYNLITEYMPSGNLRGHMKKFGKISRKVLANFSRQILNGLSFLHSRDPPVIHRDLKCDNIFVSGVSSPVTLKIGDMGLATLKEHSSAAKSIVGTPEFMAPEMFLEQYDEYVDIWAFGMVLLEMVTGRYPYEEAKGTSGVVSRIIKGEQPEVLRHVEWPELRAVIQRCIHYYKYDRFQCAQLMRMSFFSDPALPIRMHLMTDDDKSLPVTKFPLWVTVVDDRQRDVRRHVANDFSIEMTYDTNKDTPESIVKEMIKSGFASEKEVRIIPRLIREKLEYIDLERKRRALSSSIGHKPHLKANQDAYGMLIAREGLLKKGDNEELKELLLQQLPGQPAENEESRSRANSLKKPGDKKADRAGASDCVKHTHEKAMQSSCAIGKARSLDKKQRRLVLCLNNIETHDDQRILKLGMFNNNRAQFTFNLDADKVDTLVSTLRPNESDEWLPNEQVHEFEEQMQGIFQRVRSDPKKAVVVGRKRLEEEYAMFVTDQRRQNAGEGKFWNLCPGSDDIVRTFHRRSSQEDGQDQIRETADSRPRNEAHSQESNKKEKVLAKRVPSLEQEVPADLLELQNKIRAEHNLPPVKADIVAARSPGLVRQKKDEGKATPTAPQGFFELYDALDKLNLSAASQRRKPGDVQQKGRHNGCSPKSPSPTIDMDGSDGVRKTMQAPQPVASRKNSTDSNPDSLSRSSTLSSSSDASIKDFRAVSTDDITGQAVDEHDGNRIGCVNSQVQRSENISKLNPAKAVKKGRFAVFKVIEDETAKPIASKEYSAASQSASVDKEKKKGRFTISKVEEKPRDASSRNNPAVETRATTKVPVDAGTIVSRSKQEGERAARHLETPSVDVSGIAEVDMKSVEHACSYVSSSKTLDNKQRTDGQPNSRMPSTLRQITRRPSINIDCILSNPIVTGMAIGAVAMGNVMIGAANQIAKKKGEQAADKKTSKPKCEIHVNSQPLTSATQTIQIASSPYQVAQEYSDYLLQSTLSEEKRDNTSRGEDIRSMKHKHTQELLELMSKHKKELLVLEHDKQNSTEPKQFTSSSHSEKSKFPMSQPSSIEGVSRPEEISSVCGGNDNTEPTVNPSFVQSNPTQSDSRSSDDVQIQSEIMCHEYDSTHSKRKVNEQAVNDVPEGDFASSQDTPHSFPNNQSVGGNDHHSINAASPSHQKFHYAHDEACSSEVGRSWINTTSNNDVLSVSSQPLPIPGDTTGNSCGHKPFLHTTQTFWTDSNAPKFQHDTEQAGIRRTYSLNNHERNGESQAPFNS